MSEGLIPCEDRRAFHAETLWSGVARHRLARRRRAGAERRRAESLRSTSRWDCRGGDRSCDGSAEFVWRAKNESNTFAKGFVGGGWLNDGSLDDEDFLVGQIKFKDTFSRIQGNSLVYGTIDLGQDFTLLDGATKVTVGPFAGFNFWQETQVGYGARCNRDDVDGAVCGPPGFISALRLHAELVGRRGRALLARGGRPRQHRVRAFPNQGRAERLHQRALRRVRRRDL
jgi:hypothetical protein